MPRQPTNALSQENPKRSPGEADLANLLNIIIFINLKQLITPNMPARFHFSVSASSVRHLEVVLILKCDLDLQRSSTNLRLTLQKIDFALCHWKILRSSSCVCLTAANIYIQLLQNPFPLSRPSNKQLYYMAIMLLRNDSVIYEPSVYFWEDSLRIEEKKHRLFFKWSFSHFSHI